MPRSRTSALRIPRTSTVSSRLTWICFLSKTRYPALRRRVPISMSSIDGRVNRGSKPPIAAKTERLMAPHPAQNVEASARPSWWTKW